MELLLTKVFKESKVQMVLLVLMVIRVAKV